MFKPPSAFRIRAYFYPRLFSSNTPRQIRSFSYRVPHKILSFNDVTHTTDKNTCQAFFLEWLFTLTFKPVFHIFDSPKNEFQLLIISWPTNPSEKDKSYLSGIRDASLIMGGVVQLFWKGREG